MLPGLQSWLERVSGPARAACLPAAERGLPAAASCPCAAPSPGRPLSAAVPLAAPPWCRSLQYHASLPLPPPPSWRAELGLAEDGVLSLETALSMMELCQAAGEAAADARSLRTVRDVLLPQLRREPEAAAGPEARKAAEVGPPGSLLCVLKAVPCVPRGRAAL